MDGLCLRDPCKPASYHLRMQNSNYRGKRFRRETGKAAIRKRREKTEVLIQKAQIVAAIAENHKGRITKATVRVIVNDLIAFSSHALVSGCALRLGNLGTMRMRESNTHEGGLGKGNTVSFKMAQPLKVLAREANKANNKGNACFLLYPDEGVTFRMEVSHGENCINVSPVTAAGIDAELMSPEARELVETWAKEEALRVSGLS